MSVPADRVEKFLRDNPEGTLWVTMGYASAFGLAWLDERTRGRPVRLLIGDLRTGFTNWSEVDRVAAVRFVQRPDVSVLNWHPAGGSVHSKYYIVEPNPAARIAGDVLLGSANLTRQGLHSNSETLSRAHPDEHERLRAEMRHVMGQSWSVRDQLLQRLGAVERPWEDALPGSASSRFLVARRGRELAKAAAVLVGLFLVLLVVLPWILGQLFDSGEPSTGSEPPAAAFAPASAPSTAPDSSEGPDAVPSTEVETVQHDVAVPTVPTTLPDRPEVDLAEPPPGWTPEIDGNASTYGTPGRDDLQWVAWQPNCPTCEAGATLTWVGSYAYPFDGGAILPGSSNRPKLQSACLHRKRSGPLIDWHRDMSGDRIQALIIDGESVQPGLWWTGGSQNRLMVPEPGAFVEMLSDAQELRVLTAGGLDATFNVDGFLTTPVQGNLDHCGHYP